MSCSVLVDATGRISSLDAFNRLRVSQPHAIFDSKQIYDSNPLFFVTSTIGGGAASFVAAKAASELTLGTASGDSAIRQTKRYFNYQPGKGHFIMVTFNLQGTQANVAKRVGYFDVDNGIFLQTEGTAVSVVLRSKATGSPVNETILQASWNIDPMDGTGPSGITLDLTKMQILLIDFQWLGVGSARVGFVINGDIHYIHQFHHANILDVVYMSTPNLPVRWEIINTGVSAGTPQLDANCCSIMSEGGLEPTGVVRSADRGIIVTSVSAALEPVISIRLKSTHNRQTVIPRKISLMSTTGANLRWALILNPTITGGTVASWGSVSDAVEADTARDGTASAGTLVDSGYMSNNGDFVAAELDTQLTIASDFSGASDELVLCAQRVSGGSESVLGSIAWLEVL